MRPRSTIRNLNRGRGYGFVERPYARRPDLSERGSTVLPWLTFTGRDLAARRQPVPVGGLRYRYGENPSIAPVMDCVGFRAIDFTTSTHMGVAVRYKKEDPWERIRLMAAATPNTPLQFMSTGFRFISWETASPDFMALAFRTLARNGIRRFCLADPMNDAESNMACARMVKQGGGDFVIVALVFTLSPIHDDAHYVERARQLAACPFVDALYIKDPGGLLSPARAQTLIPAITACSAPSRWNCILTAPSGSPNTLTGRTQSWRVGAAVCFRRCRRRHLEPAFRARGPESAGVGASRGRR
jgi:oxaloacetate decarboxylase alpha subunit